MKSYFSKFLYLFNRKEKLQILAIFLLMLAGALLETFVVGIFYPFISILKKPEIIQDYKVLRWIYYTIGVGSSREFLIWTAVGLIIIYLLKNTYLVLLTYTQFKFMFNKQIAFSHRLFNFYLHQPYTFYLQRNTAEILQKINVVVPLMFSGFMLPAMMLVVEIITTIFILCLLILLKPLPSILAIGMLGTATFVFYQITRKKTGEFGKLRQHHSEQMMQWVNQGLGGIKEIKILGREAFFASTYDKNCKVYARAERFINMINQLQRPFLETICIMSMLLITLLMIITQNKNLETIIPTLSLFTMAAFRIIPSLGRIFTAATAIRYNSYSFDTIYNDLIIFDKHIVSTKSEVIKQWLDISFDKTIELRDVCYQYPNAKKPSLNGVSLTISKHCSIGFVGPTGAGKTTIVDIIVGLLEPTHGEVQVDGKNIKNDLSSWQRQIGYIPQNVYLSDDTIRRNIAFGLHDEQIDEDQIWSALESAQLKVFIDSLSDKLDTFVGERGIRLSGGQRQRIGIARALYRNPEILVMDEGTASLDNETEWEIMEAVKRLSGEKTVIIIAHRLSTVKNCDRLYFIKDGKVIDQGTYNELLDKSLEFKSMVMAAEYT